MQLEEIKISVSANTQQAITALSNLNKTLRGLQALSQNGMGLDYLVSEIKNFSRAIDTISESQISKIERLANALAGLNGVNITRGIRSATRAFSDLGAEAGTLDFGTSVQEGCTAIAVYTGEVTALVPIVNSASGATDRNTGATEANTGVQTRNTGAIGANTGAQSGNTGATGANTGATESNTGATESNTAARSENTRATRHGTGEQNLNNNATNDGTTSTNRFTTALGRLSSMFRRIILYMAIRSAIRGIISAFSTGLKDLYQYSAVLNSMDSGSFKTTMDEYASTVLKLKNALATALAPVLEMLLPVFEKIAGWIVKACNGISKFFAIIRGQSTYTIAKDVSTTWQDTADSTEEANEAAEEYKNTLLGFDEINALNGTNSGSSTSTSGDSKNYGDMFEEVPVGEISETMQKVISFATRLKNLASHIWSIIQKIWNKLDEWGVFDTIEEIVGYIDEHFDSILLLVGAIGLALLGLKVSSALSSFIATLGSASLASNISALGALTIGATLAVAGFTMEYESGYQYGKTGDTASKWATLIDAALGVTGTTIAASALGISASVTIPVSVVLAMAIADDSITQGIKDAREEERGIIDTVNEYADAIPTQTVEEQTKSKAEALEEALEWYDENYDMYMYLAHERDKSDDDETKHFDYVNFQILEDEMKAWSGLFGGEEWVAEVSTLDAIKNIQNLKAQFDKVGLSVNRATLTPKVDTSTSQTKFESLTYGYMQSKQQIEEDPTIVNVGIDGGQLEIAHLKEGYTIVKTEIGNDPIVININTTDAMTNIAKLKDEMAGLANAGAGMLGNYTGYSGVSNQNAFTDYLLRQGGSGGGSSFANGGIVSSDIFMANENGTAEMIGSFGSRTAVANNDQIIAGIASGVSSAMSQQNSILNEQNSLLKQLLNKEFNVSTSSFVSGLSRENRRAGTTVVAMG